MIVSYLHEFARVLAPDGEAFVQVPVLRRRGAALARAREPLRRGSLAAPSTARHSAASG